MAETMVEKVARAIALEHLDPETRAAVDHNKWFVAESYFDLARAAIEAMRDPTEEMKKAGAFRYREIPLGNGMTAQGLALGDDPVNSYRMMIDAALKEISR